MTQPKPSDFSQQEQLIDSDASTHAYRFEDLSNEAKEVAIVQVHLSESMHSQNFDDDYDQAQAKMKELFEEAGLTVLDNIYWKYTNTAFLDFSDVRMTASFIKQHLTEEEYRIFLELNEITSHQIENKLYDFEYQEHGFVFNLHDLDYYHFVNTLALAFLVERSTDEEVRVKYKLPYLFLEADDVEELIDYDALEDFENDFNLLSTNYLASFSQKISEPVETLAHTCINMINNLESYLGSKEYYKHQLASKSLLEALYRFDETGAILTRNDT